MTERLRTAGIVLAALLLGIMVSKAGADGPVIWKQHCPVRHEVRLEKAEDWGGFHVLCVRMAEEAPGARK